MSDERDESAAAAEERPEATASSDDANAADAARVNDPGDAPAGNADQADEAAQAAGDASALHEELAETRDKLVRAVAEAENIRKRAEKEVADMRVFALTNFSRDLLSVSDNLSRALAHITPEMRNAMADVAKTLVDGIEMTQRELHAAFNRNGVTAIEVNQGDRLDPNRHQAATTIPSDQPANSVVSVIQSGWMIGERILRPAMVAVSSGVQPRAASGDAGGAAAPAGDETAPGANDGAGAGGTLDTKV